MHSPASCVASCRCTDDSCRPEASRRHRCTPGTRENDAHPLAFPHTNEGLLSQPLDLDPASEFHDEHMTATTTAIQVAGLTKSFGDHTVLTGVDLTVPEGTVYALLGPNGAGKTTIVNILSTLLAPGDGEIRVAGFDVRREAAGVRRAIGVT